MHIPFCKFHGFGNDYIVIERSDVPADADLPHIARDICDRHTGAGADGIAVLSRSDDFDCEIVNPDGSAAGFSGNGTRCAAAYLYYKKLWSEPNLRLVTRSGVKRFRLLDGRTDGSYTFEAEIGTPRWHPQEIPAAGFSGDSVLNETIDIGSLICTFSAVNVGNPVACMCVDNFDLDWRSLGRSLESHSMFPERCNIVFVRVLDRDNIDIRIWERGAGETAASGTCASGAAVIAARLGLTARDVSVNSPGGISRVRWRDDDEMVLTGEARLAYCGEWPARPAHSQAV
jgi:diaminopimelate epimerase